MLEKAFDWEQTIIFDAYSNWSGFENILIPTVLNWREVFVLIGSLMLTSTSPSLIKHEFNHTLYGHTPYFCVRDFDFNNMLISLANAGVIEVNGVDKVVLTPQGQGVLFEVNTADMIKRFASKRLEAKVCIESMGNGR